MLASEYSLLAADEIKRTLLKISGADVEKLVDLILSSKRIYSAGIGRSGFMIRAFGMRLMHLGIESYIVGETITPAIGSGDLLIIGSGSGETGSLITIGNKAKKTGASVALITIHPDSTIGKLSDITIRIDASTPKAEKEDRSLSVQPMGTMFEQCLLILLDSIIVRLMEKKNISAEEMFVRHANLE